MAFEQKANLMFIKYTLEYSFKEVSKLFQRSLKELDFV